MLKFIGLLTVIWFLAPVVLTGLVILFVAFAS